MLTSEEVLSDAGGLVLDLLQGLQGLNLTPEEQAEALSDAKEIFDMASKIVEEMLCPSEETIH